jgi:DNA cross-link repair 1A protein
VSGQSTTGNAGANTRSVDSFMAPQNTSLKKKEGKILIVVGYFFFFLPKTFCYFRSDLYQFSTYSIGKERIVKGIYTYFHCHRRPLTTQYKAIAKALDTKVYCDARKAAILRCQSDPELHALLTTDPLSAGVHIAPLGTITSDKLKTYMDKFKGTYTRAIGFRPTGWTYVASLLKYIHMY